MTREVSKQRPTVREVTRRYYSVWWAYSFGGAFLFGVYPLFLRARGLSQFEINSVLAIYFAMLVLTDVPTGAFADAIGRRRSFLLGCALRMLAFFVYFFAHHYWVFVIAESIDGIGTTFGNGAIDAWGVDALDEAGFEGLKDRLFSRVSQLTSLGFMGGAVIGAYVADINIAWPWLLGSAGYLMAAVVGGFMMHNDRGSSFDLRGTMSQLVGRISDALRLGFTRREVLLLSIANAIQIGAWAPYWLEWPRYFTDSYGVGIWIVGWLYCLLTIARMLGAEAVVRLPADHNARIARLNWAVAGGGVLLIVAGTAGARPTLVLGVLFLTNLCTGAVQPIVSSWFNEQIDSANRATLISFESTLGTLGGSIGLLINGFIADRYGLGPAWQFAGLISLAAVPCYLALRPRLASPAIIARPAS